MYRAISLEPDGKPEGRFSDRMLIGAPRTVHTEGDERAGTDAEAGNGLLSLCQRGGSASFRARCQRRQVAGLVNLVPDRGRAGVAPVLGHHSEDPADRTTIVCDLAPEPGRGREA